MQVTGNESARVAAQNAKDAIAERGWTHHELMDPETGQVCVMGAAGYKAAMALTRQEDRPGNQLNPPVPGYEYGIVRQLIACSGYARAAQRYLARLMLPHIREQFPERLPPRRGRSETELVEYFNDHEDTGVSDVELILDKVIANA